MILIQIWAKCYRAIEKETHLMMSLWIISILVANTCIRKRVEIQTNIKADAIAKLI